ncbi:MAG: membrane protein insertion efficiency factor YidD [Planctomycetes bacterium]|nr:membrane protein insertion efficiency factor YidD [Planctomycetota bacterium]
MRKLIINLLISLVKMYQVLLSPLHLPSCRFQPTCSDYCIQSLKEKGIIKGLLKSAWRLLRCHPLGGSGYDPVS